MPIRINPRSVNEGGAKLLRSAAVLADIRRDLRDDEALVGLIPATAASRIAPAFQEAMRRLAQEAEGTDKLGHHLNEQAARIAQIKDSKLLKTIDKIRQLVFIDVVDAADLKRLLKSSKPDGRIARRLRGQMALLLAVELNRERVEAKLKELRARKRKVTRLRGELKHQRNLIRGGSLSARELARVDAQIKSLSSELRAAEKSGVRLQRSLSNTRRAGSALTRIGRVMPVLDFALGTYLSEATTKKGKVASGGVQAIAFTNPLFAIGDLGSSAGLPGYFSRSGDISYPIETDVLLAESLLRQGRGKREAADKLAQHLFKAYVNEDGGWLTRGTTALGTRLGGGMVDPNVPYREDPRYLNLPRETDDWNEEWREALEKAR